MAGIDGNLTAAVVISMDDASLEEFQARLKGVTRTLEDAVVAMRAFQAEWEGSGLNEKLNRIEQDLADYAGRIATLEETGL